jgi:hypothetical protein
VSGAAEFLIDLNTLDDVTIAGSKAFNLGRMATLGLPTPAWKAPPALNWSHGRRPFVTG